MKVGERVQTTDKYHPRLRLVGRITHEQGGTFRMDWDGVHRGVAWMAKGWVEPEGSPSEGRELWPNDDQCRRD